MRQRWARWSLCHQVLETFSLVEAEGRDVDEAVYVRRVVAESGHDLTTVGVSYDHRRAILAVQHLAQPRDVVRQRRLGELRCGDVIVLRLQPLDDAIPARSVGPGAMHEDDVRQIRHCAAPSGLLAGFRTFCLLLRRPLVIPWAVMGEPS